MANPIFLSPDGLSRQDRERLRATDPTLTGAANAILAKNITINPMDGQDVSRDLIRSYLGNQASIPAGLTVVLTFDTEIAGSGVAGTVPPWGILARGAGCAEVIVDATSVTYSPVSDSMESLYLKFWLGNTLHALKGSGGTGKATLNAQGIPVISWTITGLFIPPAEVTRATPVLTAFQKPLLVTNANTPVFTVNGVALAMRNYAFDFGNKVEPRLLVGREDVQVTDRAEAIDVTTCEASAAHHALIPTASPRRRRAGPRRHHPRRRGRQHRHHQRAHLADEAAEGLPEQPGRCGVAALARAPQPNAGNDQFSDRADVSALYPQPTHVQVTPCSKSRKPRPSPAM